MTKEEKTHWKKNFNYDYHGAYSLMEGQEVTLTIKSVRKEQVTGAGGSKEECTVCDFKEDINGDIKPMILNKTNCKTIEKLYDTPFIEEWVGKRVTVFVANNIKAFGDVVDALRIKAIVPVDAKPKLTPKSDKWKTAAEAVKKGTTISAIRKHYDISDGDFKELEKEAQNV